MYLCKSLLDDGAAYDRYLAWRSAMRSTSIARAGRS